MANQDGSVLVIGATGQQGGATARALLERGRVVHALVRDPAAPAARSLHEAGAALVTGNLDDPLSLRAAMSGASGVFLVLTMLTGPRVTLDGVAAEERRGKLVAEIAAETGVRHLVYSSVAGADLHTGIPHIESKGRIEERLRALNVPATILRPSYFMDNFATFTRPTLEAGELIVRLALRPQTRLALIATRDIGALAAICFDQPGQFLGRHLEIAGDSLPGPEIARAFGEVSGLPARFEQMPIEQLRAFDGEVANMFEWIDHRPTEGPDLAALRKIHPGLMTLATWLRDTTWKADAPGADAA